MSKPSETGITAEPKKPKSNLWKRTVDSPAEHLDRCRRAGVDPSKSSLVTYDRPLVRLRVISAVEFVDYRGVPMWQYHVSMSQAGGHVDPMLVDSILADFDMVGAEEDNHENGRARHFWKLVAEPGRTLDCDCKGTDARVELPDGYTYTTDKLKGKQ